MIRFARVYKAFGGRTVLDGIDLEVARGQSLVVIGASGSGKSVLLKCALGLLKPDAGTITIGDAPTTGTGADDAFFARFGMLFQGAALFDSLPVWRNVAFRLLRTHSRQDARAIAIEKLARVGLEADVADHFPAELSGGMQKRVGLARAIAAGPDIIFFDEPTAGLDPIMAGTINNLIRDIVSETKATTISITHEMSTLRQVADRVALLHDGHIRWHGTPSAMGESQDEQVQRFLRAATLPPTSATTLPRK